MSPVPSVANDPPFERAALATLRHLLALPLPEAGPDAATALGKRLQDCAPLSYLALVQCVDDAPAFIAMPGLTGALPEEMAGHACQFERLPAQQGWCTARIHHGDWRGIVACTPSKYRGLIQHLLEVCANHFSLLQADHLLELSSSPLLNRIPFWQEKLDSFTRLLRLGGSLPARQLFAQFDSTLRFWMGAKEVLLLQRRESQIVSLYPVGQRMTEALMQELAQPKAVHKEEACLFWYSLPIQMNRQYYCSLCLALDKPMVPEDRQLLLFMSELAGLLAELYQLREFQHQHKEANPSQHVPDQQRLQQLQRLNLRLQRQLKQRDELEREMQLDAQRDPLTQLANRTLFLHRLDHALKHYKRYPEDGFAVLLIDLVSLRQVNEQYGDELGDLLLKHVAHMLRLCVRQNDLVARLSGDEFIVLLDASSHAEHVTPIISRILNQLQQPLLLEGNEVTIHANLGVATVSPSTDESAQLLRQADIATFQAKRRGLNQAVFYSELCDVPDHLSPEQALQQALQEKRILPYVQPVMRLKDRRITHLELVARLLESNGEVQDAMAFIPLAEQSELILDIDRTMLRHACGLLTGLYQPLMHDNNLRLSLNLSGRHLVDRQHIQELMEIIQQAAISPKLFIFEFKERDLMRRDSQTLTLLHELRAKGIGIAVDDFGTGFGSLNSLFHYPVDFIKVDDSFTHRLLKSNRDRALVRAIRDISHDLGMQVIIEGVEERSQYLKLVEMGCDLAQGNFFSAPLPADALLSLLPSRGDPRPPAK